MDLVNFLFLVGRVHWFSKILTNKTRKSVGAAETLLALISKVQSHAKTQRTWKIYNNWTAALLCAGICACVRVCMCELSGFNEEICFLEGDESAGSNVLYTKKNFATNNFTCSLLEGRRHQYCRFMVHVHEISNFLLDWQVKKKIGWQLKNRNKNKKN